VGVTWFWVMYGTSSLGGLLADWFGPSAIGWFAAAIYGAAMLAATADGFFGWRQPMTTTNLKEGRHALCAP
jgi:hypothetical protein